ncbi:hypothetical protein PAMA_015176 [Pampus argenteus]
MSGSSSTNNSWTILTPEETVAETLRPLAEGTEHHEESHTSAAGSGANIQPAEGLPAEEHLVSEENKGELSEDSRTDHHSYVPTAITDAPAPSSVEVLTSSIPGSDALSQSEGLAEGPAQSSPDPDSFSDSYTHITPSPDEPPTSLLSTETLGGVEFTQEEERLAQEGTPQSINGEELQQEGEETDLSLGKQADSPGDSEVPDERAETGEEGEPEVRRRRSLLAALERIGRAEEDEEVEEDFQLPQREEGSGFSVNKCILGAIILLGLGTIFFSGVFMDLDEESDYNTRELKESEVPGKQEWLNPEVPPPPVDADSTDHLNNENQQISVLQAQLQAQKEELKVAKGQAAEGATERLRWEEVEKENSSEAFKVTMKPTASPPSGQLEESKPGIAGATGRQTRKPLDDQWAEKKKDWKDKHDMAEKKEQKERETSEWKVDKKKESKDAGKIEGKEKELNKRRYDEVKFDKEKGKEGKQKKHSDDKQGKEKDGRRDQANRGDDGKLWKDREGKKEWTEKSGRKDLKEEKDSRNPKHDKQSEGKQWRGKEDKNDRKKEKYGEKHKGKEEWKGEKEWKKGKDGFKESDKHKWEKKDWRERGEKTEWKKDGERKSKDHGKEGKGKGERKQEKSENHGKNYGKEKGNDEKKQRESDWKTKNGKDNKDWKRKDERKQWEKKENEWKRAGQKEKKHNGDWKTDKSSFQKNRDEHKSSGNHHHREERLWGEKEPPHTHRKPSLDQPEYWVKQRGRLQHNPKPQQCNSVETCAQVEGLLPVPLPEFEAILQTYLAKAEEVGVDSSKREELKKLSTEFFKDGVFAHNQMSFQDFVEDVSDILEDMVEVDGGDEDSALEDEMEEFEREVIKKFSMPGAGEKEERIKGEWRKESGQARG